MKIINNLKGIRTQRKIAQKQLAMDTGYDPRTIRRVELGECCPSAEFMFDILCILKSFHYNSSLNLKKYCISRLFFL